MPDDKNDHCPLQNKENLHLVHFHCEYVFYIFHLYCSYTCYWPSTWTFAYFQVWASQEASNLCREVQGPEVVKVFKVPSQPFSSVISAKAADKWAVNRVNSGHMYGAVFNYLVVNPGERSQWLLLRLVSTQFLSHSHIYLHFAHLLSLFFSVSWIDHCKLL